MTILRTSLVLSLLPIAVPAQDPVWYPSPVNGNVYTLTPYMTWQQAEAFAVGLGGHLAAVRTQEERDWLFSKFGNQQLWVGVNDAAEDGRFIRSSGDPAEYFPWAPGMPNGTAGSDYVLRDQTGWINASGGVLRQGIVELADLAAYDPFGFGCAGSVGVPTLAAAPGSVPRLGEILEVRLGNLPAGAGNVFVLFGFSKTSFGAIPLPADLSSFGITGCTGYVSADAAFLISPVGGEAEWTLDIPTLPRLLDVTFYNQALVEDPGVNPFGAVMTSAAEATIGAPEPFPTGFGPPLGSSPVLVASGAFAVLGAFLGQIVGVNLETGDRTLLSSEDGVFGTGPTIESVNGLDMVGDRVFIASGRIGGGVVQIPPAIFALDPLTGERSIISDAVTGTGTPLDIVHDLECDGARAIVTVAGFDRIAIMAVDVSTGDRTILSDDATGQGPAFSDPRQIALQGDRALVSEPAAGRIMSVDLDSGDRTILSDGGHGGGPDFTFPFGLALDGNRLIVTDTGNPAASVPGRVFAVDLATGDRTIVSDDVTGTGPSFDLVYGLTLQGGRALVAENSTGNLLSADLQTGDRVLVSK